MGYINKNLLPTEHIVFRTHKHMIIFSVPFIWMLCMAYLTVLLTHPARFPQHLFIIPQSLTGILWGTVLLFWAYIWLEYRFSEFVVTNKRIMMREGFFNRHASEVRIDTISQVNIDQSILGQLCDYGVLSINTFGAFDRFTLIAKPYAFQKAVHEQLDQAK